MYVRMRPNRRMLTSWLACCAHFDIDWRTSFIAIHIYKNYFWLIFRKFQLTTFKVLWIFFKRLKPGWCHYKLFSQFLWNYSLNGVLLKSVDVATKRNKTFNVHTVNFSWECFSITEFNGRSCSLIIIGKWTWSFIPTFVGTCDSSAYCSLNYLPYLTVKVLHFLIQNFLTTLVFLSLCEHSTE